jgi:N utilization substance protein A
MTKLDNEKKLKNSKISTSEKHGRDILLVVDAVSNEKGLPRETIFRAIELALASITAKLQEPKLVKVRVSINRETGEYETFRQWAVVENVETPDKEINLKDAKKIDADLELGDMIEEPIESVDFGRIAAQQAKQIILREIRQAEREEVSDLYREKIGAIVTGIVKRVQREQVILDLGEGVEALLTRDNMLPQDSVQIGDRIKSVLIDVKLDKNGLRLVVSRTAPQMLVQLFKLEVPEISEEVIEIKSVARDPGYRSKIAVKTNDGRIDPIGACIGIRGSRVQAVSNELNGERIDIILWNDDPAQLVVNAMAPAEISSIVVDEESHSMDIAVTPEQLAQAIGRNGQNIHLASQLTKWNLNVMTNDELKNKSQTRSGDVAQLFVNALDVDEDLANLLVNEGFFSLEDVAYVPKEEMLGISGFNGDIVDELQNRAKNALLNRVLTGEAKITESKPEPDLLNLDDMTKEIAYALAAKGIISREDLAEKSVDELEDIEGLDEELAAKLIMNARAHWFK